LRNPVEFSRWIRAVCIPEQSYADVVGVGTAVGWGKTYRFDPGTSSTPKQLEIPTVNASYCLTKYSNLAEVSSENTFCAGFANQGKGTCLGDSGGGFYSLESATSPWIVRGIVSGSLTDQLGKCDVDKFQLYTNVARFADWIGKIMKKTGNVALEFVEFVCEYRE
jgi:secreted trypsin-like serine protease